jgi:tripartite-type tricarboxylate transporter receptor subunit TctC
MLAGQIDAMFETLPSVLPLVRDGRIKALAVTTPKRVPLLPDVPSLAEAGYPGLEVTTWYAVVAPAGTPKAALDRLSAEYRRIGEQPKTQQFLAEQGLIYVPVSPEEFTQLMLKESDRWATIIRQQNIKVE